MRGHFRIATQPVSPVTSHVGRLTHSLTLVFFMDLMQHYDVLLPPTLAKKKRESERKVPQRKRTAIVDMRMKRSNLTNHSDLKEGTLQHDSRRTGPGSRSSVSTTTGPPESVRILTSRQDNKAEVPSILRPRGGSTNTSPVPPPRSVVAPKPTVGFSVPPPPPLGAGFVAPLPPGFIPPPPPPPLVAESRESPSLPEPETPDPDDDGYVPPPRPLSFKDPPESPSPTPASDPPSRSSSPAVGGTNKPGLQRGPSGLMGPRTSGGITRGPRTSGVPPAPGRRGSLGQNTRPQTPPSPKNNFRGAAPGSRGSYNPSAHRRRGSGSGIPKRPADSEAGVN